MWVSLVIDSGYLVSNDRLDTQSCRDKLAKMLNLQDLQEAPDMAQRYHRRARTGLHYHAKKWQDEWGLSEKMVQEAISIMGTGAVVIAILITHWKNELGLIDKTPATYLWGMIRKAKSGNMDLPKTIYSLQNRK